MENPHEIDLWSGAPPDGLLQHPDPASVLDDTRADQRLNRRIANISSPRLSVHKPEGPRATRTAVLVFPGGGYREVWVDKEGYDIARWLNTLGLTAFVVQYRVGPASAPQDFREVPPEIIQQVLAASLADGQRALRLVRHRAVEWDIDPDRIGVIGFSAGGHLALHMLEAAGAGDPQAADPVDRGSSRPDFSILVYPGVSPEFSSLPQQTGPVFITQACDDDLTPAGGAARLLKALLEAGIPVEAHLFRQGGHGFGLGIEGGPVRNWMHLCEEWLRALGFLAPRAW